ncbi:hypothetical protein BUALT_Bualt16G0077900 [Buddleja alternifolia]|uniref:Uncharacterized protein n=1 Tax=Buddleja alternifolia TaxID=168488 RepID=A0AAV6WKK5_9LAMI|nr:hypothetical protein BUALT_Bualt16G0077900 [Buddleja alternifolia]
MNPFDAFNTSIGIFGCSSNLNTRGLFPPRALGPLDLSLRRNIILALTIKGGVMCITIPDRYHRKGSRWNG